jgi:glycosyltransferase involved in cell wall biosynthesis
MPSPPVADPPIPDPSLAARLRIWPKRLAWRAVRRGLVRWARTPARSARGAEPTVHILIVSAYGMGGTIRTIINLAEHLARHHRVEIINVHRRRDTPFFGAWPAGVEASALDDCRPGAVRNPLERRLRDVLRRRTSVLYHRHDRRAAEFNLWTDVQLARKLRRCSGWLITTRPGLNLAAAELAPPTVVRIGQEHMHLENHGRSVRRAARRRYPELDALVLLTERDREGYRAFLGEGLRLDVIPNAARPLDGPDADLESRTVLAAGRFRRQKGYDMLLKAWAQVTAAHPDWRLRLCGGGEQRKELQALVEELGIGATMTMEPPVDMAEAMSGAAIFALSSRAEGLPLTLLEAMSKRMGIVSFDCPTGPREVVEDRRNGLLIPPADVDAFAAGLLELIEDPELLRRCADGAADTAKRYTMAGIGARWETLLAELWRERTGAAPPVLRASRATGARTADGRDGIPAAPVG